MTKAGLREAGTLIAALLHLGGSAACFRADPEQAFAPLDFQAYAVEWGEGLIRFLAGERAHLTVTADHWSTAAPNAAGLPAAPFDQLFYITANLAVRGRLSEENNAQGVAARTFPAQFAIDWIRVCRCAREPETARACIR